MKLLVHAGERCEALTEDKMRDLPCQLVEVDEIWTYVKKKQKNVKEGESWEYGSKFCLIGIDLQTKLIPTFSLGDRDRETAIDFMLKLKERVSQTIQLSTDAFTPFVDAVKIAFGENVHYGQVMKAYITSRPGLARYSPPRIKSTWKSTVSGNPNRRHISTSLAERHNLTIRMQLRRFTRLTNAFSKKLGNLQATLSLYVGHYNFCRVDSAIKQTPAMCCGLTDHVWSIQELLVAGATRS